MAIKHKQASHPSLSTFPCAPHHKVQDRGKNFNCAKFFEYWKQLAGTLEHPSEKADLVEVRFYMQWPVCDPKLADPKAKNRVHEIISGPLFFENPEDYLQEVPRRMGSGGWHVVLNEVNVHGELMEGYFSAIDLNNFPPKLDLRTLVRGVPENADYIRWLHVNNQKVPWEHPDEEEDEMAGEATKTLADAVITISQSAIQSERDASEAKIDAVEARLEASQENNRMPLVDAAAAAESIKLVTSTANAANTAAFGFADKMVDMVTKNSGSQYDPLAMVEKLHAIMKPATQGDESMKLMVEAFKDGQTKMVEMQTKHLQFMEKVLEQRNATTANGDGGPLSSLDAIVDQADKIGRLAQVFGFSKDSGSREPREPQPPAGPPSKSMMESISENIVPICTAITTVFTMGANLFYNMKLKPGEVPQDPGKALQTAQANAPIQAFQQQQSAQPQQPAAAQDPRAAWRALIEHIALPLETHLFQNDLDGYTFAEFIQSDGTGGAPTSEGRRKYLVIRETLGRAGFDQLIKEHHPLWSKLQGMPQLYEGFLDEFFGYDEWQAEQQKAEEAVTA